MKTVASIASLVTLVFLVSSPVLAVEYTAYKLVYDKDGTPGSGDEQIQKAKDFSAHLTSGTGTTAKIAYSGGPADTVAVWNLANGYQSAVAPTNIGNPFPGRWGLVQGINDAGNVAAEHADNNYAKFYDNHTGTWQWNGSFSGPSSGGVAGINATQAFHESAGDLYLYDFATGSNNSAYPASMSYAVYSDFNANGDRLAFRSSDGGNPLNNPWLSRIYLNSDGQWHDLPAPLTRATAMNDSRLIVGFDMDSTSPNFNKGYAYNYDTSTMTQIPFMTYELEPGRRITATRCFPVAINNSGQVVGYQDDGNEATAHAFIWDAVKGTRDLNSALVTDLTDVAGLPGLGFTLIHHPSDINDQGLILARTLEGGYMVLLVPKDGPPPRPEAHEHKHGKVK